MGRVQGGGLVFTSVKQLRKRAAGRVIWDHPHKPKYILSDFYAESWQGKGVNKNEFTRTQFSYIYKNYGHRAFTWNLQTDDKLLQNHQWKMSVMVINSMACLKDTQDLL